MGPLLRTPTWADFWSALVDVPRAFLEALLEAVRHPIAGPLVIALFVALVAAIAGQLGTPDPLTDPDPWEDT